MEKITFRSWCLFKLHLKTPWEKLNKNILIWLQEGGDWSCIWRQNCIFITFLDTQMNFSVFTCSVKPSPRILWSLNDRKRIKGLLKDVSFSQLASSLLSKLCYTQKALCHNKVEMSGTRGWMLESSRSLLCIIWGMPKATFMPETPSSEVTPVGDTLVSLQINLVGSDW